MNVFIALLLMVMPVQADEIERRTVDTPLLCSFYAKDGSKEVKILTWKQIQRINKDKPIYDKLGKRIKAPSKSYICQDALRD